MKRNRRNGEVTEEEYEEDIYLKQMGSCSQKKIQLLYQEILAGKVGMKARSPLTTKVAGLKCKNEKFKKYCSKE
eukprot:snap_masked-scaffold_3-processed-gene-4.17-mRNA-1 protein AED:1.00 eAED:1.00 QI:0/0/0/0/1/1/2/0/73